jgi:hypothetical protein
VELVMMVLLGNWGTGLIAIGLTVLAIWILFLQPSNYVGHHRPGRTLWREGWDPDMPSTHSVWVWRGEKPPSSREHERMRQFIEASGFQTMMTTSWTIVARKVKGHP